MLLALVMAANKIEPNVFPIDVLQKKAAASAPRSAAPPSRAAHPPPTRALSNLGVTRLPMIPSNARQILPRLYCSPPKKKRKRQELEEKTIHARCVFLLCLSFFLLCCRVRCDSNLSFILLFCAAALWEMLSRTFPSTPSSEARTRASLLTPFPFELCDRASFTLTTNTSFQRFSSFCTSVVSSNRTDWKVATPKIRRNGPSSPRRTPPPMRNRRALPPPSSN